MGIFNSIRDLLCPRLEIKYRDPKVGTTSVDDGPYKGIKMNEEGNLEGRQYVLMDAFSFSLYSDSGTCLAVTAGLLYGKTGNSRRFVSLVTQTSSDDLVTDNSKRLMSLFESDLVDPFQQATAISTDTYVISQRVAEDDAFIGSRLRNSIRAAVSDPEYVIKFFIWYHILTSLHDGRPGLFSISRHRLREMSIALLQLSDTILVFRISFIDPVSESGADQIWVDVSSVAKVLIPGRVITPVGLMSAPVVTTSAAGRFWCLTPDHHIPEPTGVRTLFDLLRNNASFVTISQAFVEITPVCWYGSDVPEGGIRLSVCEKLLDASDTHPSMYIVGLVSSEHTELGYRVRALALVCRETTDPDHWQVVKSTITPMEVFEQEVSLELEMTSDADAKSPSPEASDENGVTNVIVYGSTISTVTPEMGAAIGKRAWEITELVDKVLRSLATNGNFTGVVDRLGVTQYLLRSMKQCLQYSVYLPSLPALDALYKEIDELHTKLNSIATLVNPR